MLQRERERSLDQASDRARRRHVDRQLAANVRQSMSGSPRYDSVVIAGDEGITTNLFAARLARDPGFAGRVTIAGRPAREDRRLKAGVSLRGHAADYVLHALDVNLATLVEAITPGRWPVATRQTTCMAADTASGWRLAKVGPWQNHFRRSERPIVFGFRNSAVVAAIRSLTAEGVRRIDEEPATLAEARGASNGERPLVVDATRSGGLSGRAPGSGWGIAAAQVPLVRRSGPPPRGLEDDTAIAPLVRRDGRIDVGYVTPFADALTPNADWYAILARAIRTDREADRRELELARLESELLGVADALGLDPVDYDETVGTAWVPAPAWSAPPPRHDGVFDIRSACTPGIAAYYADGMTGAAVAGVTAAEAVLQGGDPTAAANRALRPFRRWNRVWWFETTKIAPIADGLTRLSPPVALSWPHSTSVARWASAA